MSGVPQRIVCLSAEAADWFWRIGAWEQVAGVTTFFKQPAGAPAKPRISGFSTAQMGAIDRLRPDLIVTFSDVQARLAASLIEKGYPVMATNQRTLAEIEQTLGLLARIADREGEAGKLLREFRDGVAPVQEAPDRPRVYFEEWNEPLISGIAWVSELIERAGGADIFAELRTKRAASERVVLPEKVIQADPEIILASWCGRPVQAVQITSRSGWSQLAAVRDHRIYEIAGEDILQPGFRLVHGYQQIKRLLGRKE